jgi:hypothetical protein
MSRGIATETSKLARTIGTKAEELVKTKGHFTGGDCDFLGSDMEKVYDIPYLGKTLKIVYGEGYAGGVHNTSLTIRLDKKEVFGKQNGKISCYVPGRWTKTLLTS